MLHYYGAWLRRRLRAMDLKDCLAKRPVLSKEQYKARVRNLVKTKRAQSAAASIGKGLKKVCRQVLKNKGAASGR